MNQSPNDVDGESKLCSLSSLPSWRGLQKTWERGTDLKNDLNNFKEDTLKTQALLAIFITWLVYFRDKIKLHRVKGKN